MGRPRRSSRSRCSVSRRRARRRPRSCTSRRPGRPGCTASSRTACTAVARSGSRRPRWRRPEEREAGRSCVGRVDHDGAGHRYRATFNPRSGVAGLDRHMVLRLACDDALAAADAQRGVDDEAPPVGTSVIAARRSGRSARQVPPRSPATRTPAAPPTRHGAAAAPILSRSRREIARRRPIALPPDRPRPDRSRHSPWIDSTPSASTANAESTCSLPVAFIASVMPAHLACGMQGTLRRVPSGGWPETA